MREESRVEEGARSRWTCPLCDTTQTYLAAGENPHEKAEAALRAHVRGVDDPAHGPHHEYPESFDPETLDAFIEVSTA